MKLPICQKCHEIQYPIREICGNCLSDDIQIQEINSSATLLSKSDLHHSLEEMFLNHLPWQMGMVKLQDGVHLMAHLSDGRVKVGDELELGYITDPKGRSVVVAKPQTEKKETKTISWQELEAKGDQV
jgi:uncharacterized OB-fold protein